MSTERFDDLSFPDLVKTALINGYGADFVRMGMDPQEQLTQFKNFLSRVEDTQVREIFLEIGRPLFSEGWNSCWIINLGPDTSLFIKFLTKIGIEKEGGHYYLFLEEERLKWFKEELRKICDFDQVKKRLIVAFPDKQRKIELLRKMVHNGGFEGTGWISRDCSLVMYDAGIRYRVGGALKTRRADCNVMELLISFNDRGKNSAAEYIYENYAQDVQNTLQLEIGLPWGKSARPLDQSKAKAIEEDAVEINLPRPLERRIRMAELLIMLKRTQEAQFELKKAIAEKPDAESDTVLMDKILAKLGLTEKAPQDLDTRGASKASLLQSPELLSQDLKQTEHPPTIVVKTPTANGVYLVNSASQFIFTTIDYIGPSPAVTAVITDWLGNSTSVSSGLQLPPQSGLYNLLISATDQAGRNTKLSIPFVICDPSVRKVSGWGLLKFPKATPVEFEGANFSFFVKYDKGRTAPSGDFEFSPFNIEYPTRRVLKSTSMDWLVISNNKALFQGTGTINKQGKYNFRVQATERHHAGQPDNIQVTIWDTPSIDINPVHYKGDLIKGKIEVTKN